MTGPIRRILRGTVVPPPPGSPEAARQKLRVLQDKKKMQWRDEGVDEKRIWKALKWADRWVDGVATTVTQNEELREMLRVDMMPKALDQADNWIKGMQEGIAGDEYRKAYERIGVKVKPEKVKKWEELGEDER